MKVGDEEYSLFRDHEYALHSLSTYGCIPLEPHANPHPIGYLPKSTNKQTVPLL